MSEDFGKNQHSLRESVHPGLAGYRVMEPLLIRVLK